jgi:hypothetical protein
MLKVMTKQLLILAYILFVLMLSGMARADVIGPTVGHGVLNQAVITPASGILDVRGALATPCDYKPEMMVVASKGDTLVLDVVTLVSHKSVCAAGTALHPEGSDVLGKGFQISYDLKELPLTANKTYTITFINSDLTVKYNALKPLEGFKYYRVNKQSFKGTLTDVTAVEVANSGYPQSGFALHDGEQSVPVYSPDLDLEKYKNGAVSMLGYPVELASLNGGSESLAPSSQADKIIVPVSVTRVDP